MVSTGGSARPSGISNTRILFTLYPATGKPLAAELVRVDHTWAGDLGMKTDAITDAGRESFDAKLMESTKLVLF